MKVELFSTPVFIDKVDLSRIELTETNYEPTFFSDVKSNYLSNLNCIPILMIISVRS